VLALIAVACKPLDGILWLAFQVLLGDRRGHAGSLPSGAPDQAPGKHRQRAGDGAQRRGDGHAARLLAEKLIDLGWSWLIVIGTAATFVFGYLFSLIEERRRRQKALKGTEA